MPKEKKVPVTRRALMQRINRQLRNLDRRLIVRRGIKAWTEMGEYYIVDEKRGEVVRNDIDDLEEVAREIGVLKPWETLDKESAR